MAVAVETILLCLTRSDLVRLEVSKEAIKRASRTEPEYQIRFNISRLFNHFAITIV